MLVVLLVSFATALIGHAEAAPAPTPKSKPVRIPLEEPAEHPPAARESEKAAPARAAKKETPPAKKEAESAKTAPAKKEDEMGKIEGLEIARSGNRFLGLRIVDGNFRLGFYDAKKKPVPPDVERAVLRWDPKYKLGIERAVLVPGGGPNMLTSEKFVRPPYNFKLTIVLLGGEAKGGDDAEPAGETHVIDFRQ